MFNSFSQRLILSCIVPPIVIAMLYLTYIYYDSHKVINTEIRSVAKIVSESLMDASAQALVSNQSNFISQRAVTNILMRKDIVVIEWLKLDRKRFMIMGGDDKDLSHYKVIESEIYYVPLADIGGFDRDLQQDGFVRSTNVEPALTGYMKIYIDEAYLLKKAERNLYPVYAAMLSALLLIIVAATFNACLLSGRLKRIFSFINQLDQGEYSGQLKVRHRDELDSLSYRLNKLANTLAQNQKDIKGERESLNSAIVEQMRLRDETDKANDWLKQILGVLSHEMRTPLNAVVGPIDMILNKSNNPFVIRRLENALSHVHDMLAQLDNLMDYTQLEYGQHTLHKTPVDIHDTLERVVKNYQLMAAQKGLYLTSNYNGDDRLLHDLYSIDGQRLTQILINLISNAIKFSHAGNINVSWRLEQGLKGSVLVTIDVVDQGIGISADMSKDIFEMFHQADSNISRQYGGLGIGLGLCKKYSDLFGGQLFMESVEGSGSTFTLIFHAEKAGLKSVQREAVWVNRFHSKRHINVLIIEDNIENCNVLCQLLQRVAPNIALTTECDGKASLEKIKQEGLRVDIALVDIHLPNISGFEVIRCMRRYQPTAQIIAVTADTSYGTQDACFEAGAQRFVKKPVRLVDIARIFEEVEGSY